MLVMAGDDRHPDRVYFSVQGEPEAWGGLYLSTRNGEAVRGIFVVRDTLVVQCDNVHYYVQGYDETDISMNILEPMIGGLGHHTVAHIGNMVAFPSIESWYVCNGTSITPIGSGAFSETWSKQGHFSGYSIFDPSNGLLKYNPGYPNINLTEIYGMSRMGEYPTIAQSVYWVLDFSDMLSGSGSVELSFDSTELVDSAAALLSIPGGSNKKLYTADASGNIYEDLDLETDNGSTIHCIWQSSHVQIADPGDDSDAAMAEKVWLLIANEHYPVDCIVAVGNQYDWMALGKYYFEPGYGHGKEIVTIQAGEDNDTHLTLAAEDVVVPKVPRDRVLVQPPTSAGSNMTILLSCSVSENGANVTFPLTIRGWGATVISYGEIARSLRSAENGEGGLTIY